MWYPIVIIVVTSYMLGNLNGSVCISALKAHEDVRTHGSGNAGLTNFIRSYGTASAALVIAIDGSKAVFACLLGGLLLKPYGLEIEGEMLAAAAVILGHNFPAALGFRGGKGVLCGAVAALCMDLRVFAILLVVFVLIVALTRYVSLGSVIVAALFGLCFAGFYWEHPFVVVCGVGLGALVIMMHRKNIRRLINGTESKLSLKRKSQ